MAKLINVSPLDKVIEDIFTASEIIRLVKLPNKERSPIIKELYLTKINILTAQENDPSYWGYALENYYNQNKTRVLSHALRR